MATLSIRSVTKAYDNARAVDDVSLDVADAEFVAILGPSGCGKTTLLRMVAGFVPADRGAIFIGARDVTALPPHVRNTGMVFQNYALFPHLTVVDNVGFGLKRRGVPSGEIAARCAEVLKLVRLEALSSRYPRQLSGGQQQRVAVARALAIRPDVFLLDEPLSNLDARLRHSVGLEIRALQRSLGLTTLFVTHDQTEALALADRLVVMSEGRVMQAGTAAELYKKPRNAFVASFLGRANLLPGRVEGASRFVADGGLAIACQTGDWRAGDRAILCIRPEDIRLSDAPEALAANAFEIRDVSGTYLGSVTEWIAHVGGGSTPLIVHTQNRKASSEVSPARGGAWRAVWDSSDALLLPET